MLYVVYLAGSSSKGCLGNRFGSSIVLGYLKLTRLKKT